MIKILKKLLLLIIILSLSFVLILKNKKNNNKLRVEKFFTVKDLGDKELLNFKLEKTVINEEEKLEKKVKLKSVNRDIFNFK